MAQAGSWAVPEQSSANTWLEVTVSEGENREVRKLMEAFGLHVKRLIHTEYGPWKLESLKKD